MSEWISREETVKKIKSCIMAANDAWESGYNTAMAEIIEWIKHMPTADVQPIKHGRWMNAYTWTMFHEFKSSGRGEHFWCSECEQGQKQKSNYCPNCGAKMDGDKE